MADTTLHHIKHFKGHGLAKLPWLRTLEEIRTRPETATAESEKTNVPETDE